MTRYVDLPAEGPPVGRCIVLPGRNYTPDGPLLFFAAQTASMRGWDVRQVWWEAASHDDWTVVEEVAWVGDQLDTALEGHTGRTLVVGKSLGTLAARRAAAHRCAAAWLTPLLDEPEVADVLLSYPADQLVVIGSGDPALRQDVFDRLPGERLLVPGDHVLRVPGDAAAMVASHDRFVRSFDGWLEALASRPPV